MVTYVVNRGGLNALIPSISLLVCVIGAPLASATDCSVAALSTLGVPNVTITSANDVPAVAPNPQYVT
jgi:hypothetical protein